MDDVARFLGCRVDVWLAASTAPLVLVTSEDNAGDSFEGSSDEAAPFDAVNVSRAGSYMMWLYLL